MLSATEFTEIRAFLAVAEHLNFTRAAASLGVSPSAVSQQVGRLETRLGLRLLHRTTRSVRLTDDGVAFRLQTEPDVVSLSSALEWGRSRGQSVSGTVRVHAFRTVSAAVLDEALATFLAAYPQVRVDLTVNDEPVNLLSNGHDLSLRLGEVLDLGLTAVPIGGPLHQIVVAAPAYLDRQGRVEHPADLLAHNCIRWRWPGTVIAEPWQFLIEGAWRTLPVTGNLTVDDRERLHKAVLAGVGLACVTRERVQAELHAGTMVEVLGAWKVEFDGFHLCWPTGKHMSPAMRALIDWIRERSSGSG